MPLISCLMVTADRPSLAARAVSCFARQSWPERELVVVDDGQADLEPLLGSLPPERVRYLRIARRTPPQRLGELRNLALAAARGSLVAQWDDDDWYHPDRLVAQHAALGSADATVLQATLVHVDAGELRHHPYLGWVRGGVPGTILHRREEGLGYPDRARGEDTEFLRRFAARARLSIQDAPHLFLRAYHGANTWQLEHFLRRLRNRPRDLLAWWWWKGIRGQPYRHPRFRLEAASREAFALYLEDSRRLGLLGPGEPP